MIQTVTIPSTTQLWVLTPLFPEGVEITDVVDGRLFNVTTNSLVLSTITISPPTASIFAGNTTNFTVATLDQNGAAMTATVTWLSSNTSVGTIASTGVFMAIAAGTTTITATSGSIVSNSATATVNAQGAKLTGDINGDNIVDYKDLGLLGANYGLSVGQTGYNANADLNNDGTVDYKDLGILGAHYGEQT